MPLTADQEKAGTRQLRQWLENDKRLVTFRDLSRAVGCHVDLAKNLLLSFSSSSPALHKTYLLTGPLLSSSTLARTQLTAERLKAQEDEKSLAKLSATQKIRVVELDEVSDGERNSEDGDMDDVGMDVDQDAILSNDRGAEDGISGFGDKHAQAEADALVRPEQTSRWGVVMAGEEYLEAKRGLFEAEKLSIHICALAPAPVRDPAQYLKHIPDLRAHKRYREPATYGTISGDLASSAAGSSGKGLKDGAMSFASSSKASTTKKAEPATKKEPESSRTPKAAQAQSTLGKATKKDPSPAPPSKPAKSAPAATSAAAGPSQRKSSARAKRQIQSDDEEEAETVKTDTVEPDEEVEKGKNLTSSMVRAEEDQAAMEAMMGMDMDMDMGLDDEEEETQTDTKKAAAPAKVPAKGKSTGGVRKKRKVERQVQETNAKGYTVTKTIVEEVSCSEGEEDEPVATLGKSAAKGRKSNIGQSGTSSRASSVTDTEDRKPSIGASSTSLGPKGSSSSAGGAGAGGKGKALPKPAAKPATGKSKGQSTLAGFFTKK